MRSESKMANTGILEKAAPNSSRDGGRRHIRPRRKGLIGLGATATIGIAILLAMLLTRGESPPAQPADTRDLAAPAEVSGDSGPAVTAPQTLDRAQFADLSMALTEYGLGADATDIEVIYGHPALLEAAQASDEVPANSLSFFVTENIHGESFLLEKPVVYLSIDGSPRLDPIGAFQTRTDIHHRTNRFDFALPAEFAAATFNNEDHRLALVVDTGDGIVTSANTLIWLLPADLPGVSAAA
ncbi:MAG: hypothetical protein IIB28_10755, partial [Chloroflexi bacterium]|nr:hypothetical protein [Chloroflexota bacterium]